MPRQLLLSGIMAILVVAGAFLARNSINKNGVHEPEATKTDLTIRETPSSPSPSSSTITPEASPSPSVTPTVSASAVSQGSVKVRDQISIHTSSPSAGTTETSTSVSVDTSTNSSTPESSPSAAVSSDNNVSIGTTNNSQTVSVTLSSANVSLRSSFTEGRPTHFVVKNADGTSHAVTIRELSIDTGSIAPGETKTIDFTPTKSGQFKIRIAE